MRGVGIETVWSVYTGGVERPEPLAPSSGHKVHVMMTTTTQPAAGPPTDQGGFAFSGEVALARPRAWVFYSRAQRMAEAAGRSTDLVLAGILIHEIGHVLGLKHQATGIMRPALMPRDVDQLSKCRGFSPAEAKQLRAGVTRLNVASSTH
jgi:hypothetical protein